LSKSFQKAVKKCQKVVKVVKKKLIPLLSSLNPAGHLLTKIAENGQIVQNSRKLRHSHNTGELSAFLNQNQPKIRKLTVNVQK
jgi:hypothetical protein